MKNQTFRGWSSQKTGIEGGLPKKGGLARNRGGGGFEGGWYPEAHYVRVQLMVLMEALVHQRKNLVLISVNTKLCFEFTL